MCIVFIGSNTILQPTYKEGIVERKTADSPFQYISKSYEKIDRDPPPPPISLAISPPISPPISVPSIDTNLISYNNTIVVQTKETALLKNKVDAADLNKYLEKLGDYNNLLNSIINSINTYSVKIVTQNPEYNSLGSDYSISISGDIGSQVITLVLDQGAQGPIGDIGIQGDIGPQGPQGPQGSPGQQGPFIQ